MGHTTSAVHNLWLSCSSLVALLAAAPEAAAAALLPEFYSPHLDIYQRLLVLDAAGAAAETLAAGGIGAAPPPGQLPAPPPPPEGVSPLPQINCTFPRQRE